MEKVIEEMGKLLWRRRIFYLSLTLFLGLMMAFTSQQTMIGNIFFIIPLFLLIALPITSYALANLREELGIWSMWPRLVDLIMFLSIGWMVGFITFHHLIPTNSLSLSYLIAFICGIIGGGIPYFIHAICSVDDIIGDVPLKNNEEKKERDKIAQIVIHANMWEYLAVGIIPLVIAVIKCQ